MTSAVTCSVSFLEFSDHFRDATKMVPLASRESLGRGLRAGQAPDLLLNWNPGRCPGLLCFTPLGWRSIRPEDYLGVLQSLADKGRSYFLEGGQAVDFRAEYFTLGDGGVIELEKYQSFTTKDCDFWVSMAALEHFEAKIDCKLKKGTSPADGRLAVFTTHGEPSLRIDLISGVFGIPPADLSGCRSKCLVMAAARLGRESRDIFG